MKYLIGIDGGGTKTKCVVTDFDFKQVYEATGGPSNFFILGTEKVSETIFNLLEECSENLKCRFDDFTSIVLGTAGAGRRINAEMMEQSFISYANSKNVFVKRFRVESDARISLEAAFSGKPGSILIAGTGSIMIGKDSRGNIHRVGGFGRYIGDEGSGYSLGKKGLNALSKFYDGRGELTMLSKLVSNHFKINDMDSLINAVYKNNFDIASVAQDVIYAAKKDDPVCLRIVNEETDELILHIKIMKDKLNETPLNVCFSGSIIATDNFFSRTLLKKIKDKLPDVNIKEPELQPVLGAIMLAKEYLND
jgi:N-acetylglucosamine kinase-like BadF-type ATPase